ncbi:hypothetical protein BSKO_03586 [Bryopsis sp. KO-2023]|nr:hypothetical protein BSKO_03586 [Bryopsis sp. KO-2023]
MAIFRTVLFLSQQHAPARLGRVVLEQLKAELNVKEEFRAQRIGQIEVATAARVSEPLMNQKARPNFSLWELDNEIRSQQNQHQIVATAEEDMAAIRIEAMGDIWPAKHQPQDPLTPEYFDGSSALPKQHLDFEDQNIALEKLDVDPHVRRQQPSSPCVRFPAEMIAHSCRSPSPNFWKDLLRPVKLLTHMFPPDIEREIRHLSDSECRCLLEETLYRSRLDEEFSKAISALNSPATDVLQVSDVENDVSWMASSTPLPTIPEDGHLGEAAVVMEEMTSLEVKPLAILNDDGGNDRMSSGGECEKTIVPHNRTPARCSSGIKASQGGVRPTTRPPARNGHRAKGMKLEGNSRIGVGGRNLTLQSPKAGRLRATHTSVPGRVTESRSLGI